MPVSMLMFTALLGFTFISFRSKLKDHNREILFAVIAIVLPLLMAIGSQTPFKQIASSGIMKLSCLVVLLMAPYMLLWRKERFESKSIVNFISLASVLAVQPEILVLDEPTRGMEYRLKGELMNFLREYAAQGKTVVLVTHDVETVAEYADRVILLGEGRVVVDGSKRDVLSRALLFSPQINRLVQAFARYGVPGDILTVDEVLHLLI